MFLGWGSGRSRYVFGMGVLLFLALQEEPLGLEEVFCVLIALLQHRALPGHLGRGGELLHLRRGLSLLFIQIGLPTRNFRGSRG